MKYKSFSEELKNLFGVKVYKLSLSSGCTCPNRDGRIGTGGCTFCSGGGSGDFAAPFLPIEEQISQAKKLVAKKNLKSIWPIFSPLPIPMATGTGFSLCMRRHCIIPILWGSP